MSSSAGIPSSRRIASKIVLSYGQAVAVQIEHPRLSKFTHFQSRQLGASSDSWVMDATSTPSR